MSTQAATNGTVKIDLRIIVYPENDQLIGHCLEMDIAAEGETVAAAVQNVVDLCMFQLEVAIEKGDLESVLRPAPPEYWRMYYTAREAAQPTKLRPPLQHAAVRELRIA